MLLSEEGTGPFGFIDGTTGTAEIVGSIIDGAIAGYMVGVGAVIGLEMLLIGWMITGSAGIDTIYASGFEGSIKFVPIGSISGFNSLN
jgi:hypothetical protein